MQFKVETLQLQANSSKSWSIVKMCNIGFLHLLKFTVQRFDFVLLALFYYYNQDSIFLCASRNLSNGNERQLGHVPECLDTKTLHDQDYTVHIPMIISTLHCQNHACLCQMYSDINWNNSTFCRVQINIGALQTMWHLKNSQRKGRLGQNMYQYLWNTGFPYQL